MATRGQGCLEIWFLPYGCGAILALFDLLFGKDELLSSLDRRCRRHLHGNYQTLYFETWKLVHLIPFFSLYIKDAECSLFFWGKKHKFDVFWLILRIGHSWLIFSLTFEIQDLLLWPWGHPGRLGRGRQVKVFCWRRRCRPVKVFVQLSFFIPPINEVGRSVGPLRFSLSGA